MGLLIRLAQPTVTPVGNGWKQYGTRIVAGGPFAVACLGCLGYQVMRRGQQPDQWAVLGFAALGASASIGLLTWFRATAGD